MKYGVYFGFVSVLVFLLIEGLSSALLTLNRVVRSSFDERTYTKYDELLGWAGVPDLYIKDAFGKGVYLRIDSSGFRSNEDFGINVPAGKLRLICSGDSFTLGCDVDNDHTWSNLLALRDERLETVNMGQGGYGIDQMYLWYMRDGRKFDHDIHILAFINYDIYRMKLKYFFGYGKPILKLKDERLVTENIPVPPPWYYIPRLSAGTRVIMKELKLCNLLNKIMWFFRDRNKMYRLPANNTFDAQTRKILLKVFESLNRINAEKNSSLVVVYLPMQEDCSGSASDEPRRYLSVELAKRGILFIDLIDEIRKLPPDRIDELFIEYNGHYSIRGNEYIADILYGKLFSFPEIADMFSRIR